MHLFWYMKLFTFQHSNAYAYKAKLWLLFHKFISCDRIYKFTNVFIDFIQKP